MVARIVPMAGAANNQPERIGVDDLASADDGVVRIGRLVIAPEQIVWGFSRSSGPGGQNVNKVSSRAELRLNIDELPLAEHERTRLRSLAGRRVLDDGTLQLFSQESRSQSDNKRLCVEKLTELLEQALAAPKPRRATKPSKGSKRRRLEDKRQRSEIKRNRGGAGGED